MNRSGAVNLVLTLVVAWIGVRWIPDGLDIHDPVGFGTAWETLAFDRELADLADDAPAMRARMRAGVGDASPANLKRWTRLIAKADRLIGEFAEQPDPVVQLRAFPRNDFWLLTYLLYPLRTVGQWFEDGGRPGDELLPGAVAEYTFRALDASELSPGQLEQYKRMRAARREQRQR